MNGEPPGLVRVLFVLTKLSLRRFRNRFMSRMGAAWGKKPKSGQRTATARKSPRSSLALVLIGGIVLFQAVFLSSMIVGNLAEKLESRQSVVAEREEYGVDSRRIPPRPLWPSRGLWPGPAHAAHMVEALGLLFAALATALFFLSIAGGNTDLGKVGWTILTFLDRKQPQVRLK